jgi:hypothetical protein
MMGGLDCFVTKSITLVYLGGFGGPEYLVSTCSRQNFTTCRLIENSVCKATE